MTNHYPLPNLGLCADCCDEIRLRKNGTLYAHGCINDGGHPIAHLEPTFARWLHSHAARRDYHSNRITNLARGMFRRCTLSPNRTAIDVPWVTAAQLHDYGHRTQLRTTGSDIRQPYNGERCDWVCRDVQRADRIYQDLMSKAAAA
ncbi:hypothetical protein [Streptomyces sp. f150]|uniref:hypothetical protein n=1 Tax=Streptomyces sp. f150 TaxID=1827699 RepID=UPI000BEFF5C7|nr:hypothetical protein [Streptomyces sp. f150]